MKHTFVTCFVAWSVGKLFQEILLEREIKAAVVSQSVVFEVELQSCICIAHSSHFVTTQGTYIKQQALTYTLVYFK